MKILYGMIQILFYVHLLSLQCKTVFSLLFFNTRIEHITINKKRIILKFHTTLLLFLLVSAFHVETSYAATPKTSNKSMALEIIKHFDIPSQSLTNALLEYGLQANISIVISLQDPLISKHDSSPLIGDYSIRQALEVLLSKTSFTFAFDSSTHSMTVNTFNAPKTSTPSPHIYNTNSRQEEVLVVTARHRKENLHDVPMSVSVFDGDTLELNGTQDLIQLGLYAVNTTLKVIQGTNSTMVAIIRGVGYQDPSAGLERGVGIYIDDVYFYRPQSVTLEIYDTERIEILRGPQGTLYGRNTTGGAIKYTTKRLKDDPAVNVKLSGGSFNQLDILASGSTPLANNLVKIGGSIASFSRDGFGKNLTTGDENYNKNILGVRSTLEFTPSDDLFIRIAGDQTVDSSLPISGRLSHPTGEEPSVDNIYDTHAGIANSNHPINKNKVVKRGVSSYAQWTADKHFTLTFISAYREDRSELLVDSFANEAIIGDSFFIYENKQNSQEIRLAFDTQNIHVLAGAYYLNANALSTTDGVVGFFGQSAVYFNLADVDTASWAFFGTLEIKISDTLNASVGTRYTQDKKTIETINGLFLPTSSGDLISPHFGGDGFAFFRPEYDNDGNEVFPRFQGSRNDSATTPRINLSWKPQNKLHIYASYSKGFTSGGFDPRGIYTQPLIRKGFEPEILDSYEFGLKTLHWEDRITSHSAIFYSDYKNAIIVSEVEIASISPALADQKFLTVSNAANATISGFELEVSAHITEKLSSNLAIGIIKADYNTYNEGNGDVSDQRVIIDTPKNTLSFAQTYRTDWGQGTLSIISSINYRSTSALNRGELGTQINNQSGYSLINASVVWTSHSEGLQISIHGQNLSNKQYKVSGYTGTDTYGNPRTVTVAVKYSI